MKGLPTLLTVALPLAGVVVGALLQYFFNHFTERRKELRRLRAPIRAVEMVRTIRDAIYEETKDLSREELKAYFAREAAAMRQENRDGESAQSAPASNA